jgi:signal transduction histidine kinase
VDVGITVAGGRVRLSVADDGRGPPADGVEHLEREGHMGLAGMRERISALGGSVRFGASRERGAALEVVVPVDGAREVAGS